MSLSGTSSIERRPVPGYEDVYEITRRGDVYSKRLGRFIKQRERLHHKLFIEFQIRKKKHKLFVAQAVADAYLSPADQQQIVAEVPGLRSLSEAEIETHPVVGKAALEHNVTAVAVLVVMLRAAESAAA